MTLYRHDSASYQITAYGSVEKPWEGNLSGRFTLRVIKGNRFCQERSLQLHCVKDAQGYE